MPDGSSTRISRNVYIVPAGHWYLPVKARAVGGNSISSTRSPASISCVLVNDSWSGLGKGVGVFVRSEMAVLDFVSDRYSPRVRVGVRPQHMCNRRIDLQSFIELC